MTDQELRELDAEFHTLAAGKQVQWYEYGYGEIDRRDKPVYFPDDPEGWRGVLPVPRYASTGDGMLLVIELMRAKGYTYEFRYFRDGTNLAKFLARGKTVAIDGFGDTFTETVVRAAIAALKAQMDEALLMQ